MIFNNCTGMSDREFAQQYGIYGYDTIEQQVDWQQTEF